MADGTKRRSRLGVAIRVGVLALALVLVVILALAFIPSSAGEVGSSPDPASGYAAAVARFEAVRAAERDDVYEPCRSRLLGHGRRTDVAVVLVHGLTNCPRQFVELAEAIHATGANVLILRVPRHGIADGSGRVIGGVGNVGGLTPQELSGYGDRAVDIGVGLGREVRVLGLSMGGVVSSWVAQNRSDADRVVVVAPALTLPHMPGFVDGMFRNLFSRLPNISLPGSGALDHAYKGESTGALAAMYQLSEAVRRAAAKTPPAAASIVVVTNANDDQVDNGDVRALADTWRRQGAEVRSYEFPKTLGLRHDLIDVQQPDAQPELVYPVLVGLLGLGG